VDEAREGIDERRAAGPGSGTRRPSRRPAHRPPPPAHTALVRRRGHDLGAVAAWVVDAMARDEQVVVVHAPGEDLALQGAVGAALAGTGRTLTGTLERALVLADAGTVGRRCGGDAEGLAAWHADRADDAARDGYAGVAVAAELDALRDWTLADGSLVAHERLLGDLGAAGRLRALCRCHPDTAGTELARVLAVHAHVDDEVWSCHVEGGCVHVQGEIDVANAARLADVLAAAVAAGTTVVDCSALTFCGVAGVRAVLAAAAGVGVAGCLQLVELDPFVARTFRVLGCGALPWLELRERGR
jgi:anti-anti-sigma factor